MKDAVFCLSPQTEWMLAWDLGLSVDITDAHATLGMLVVVLIILVALFGRNALGLAHPAPPNNTNKKILSSSSNERTAVIMFHKPANVLTSHISEDSRPTVYEMVQDMTRFVHNDASSFASATGIRSKLHAIGRLDAETTGLLLITNDGGLVHHVTNRNAPTHEEGRCISKTYRALIMGHHQEESLQPLWEGVDIGAKYGGMTRPVEDLQILGHPSHKTTLVSLTISEGKNRQVRRMFHALGSGVMQLQRTHMSGGGGGANDLVLSLDGLEEGQWRLLSDQEVRNCLGWERRDLEKARAAVQAKHVSRNVGRRRRPSNTKSRRKQRRR